MQATPSTWRMLLESGWKGNKQLKILCGGEALPESWPTNLMKRVLEQLGFADKIPTFQPEAARLWSFLKEKYCRELMY